MKKKFKRFWKKLFMRKLIVKTDLTNYLHVLQIVDTKDSNIISEALGITNERALEIANFISDIYKDSTDLVGAIVIISKKCKHANELYYASMILTKYHDHKNKMSLFGSIMGGSLPQP